jgi:hypothetical protein
MAMQAGLVAAITEIHLQRGQSGAVQPWKVRILEQRQCRVHGILDGEAHRSWPGNQAKVASLQGAFKQLNCDRRSGLST